MRLIATFIHLVDAIWQAANIHKRGFFADRRFGKGLPTIPALQGHFVSLSLFAVHTNMVRVFLAASTEIVRAVGASNSELCHMLSCLPRHPLACLVFGRIIWLRRVEREYFIAARTLDNVIGIGHQDLCLLFANILKPLMTECLT